jgi:hypothetical protein
LTTAPPPESPASHEPPETTVGEPAGVSQVDRLLPFVLAVMLAVVGLMGALIAWQVGTRSDAAADATLQGLIVTRARAAQESAAETTVSQTAEAWRSYESQRRRAESLRASGFPDAALEAAGRASAHWFLVHPEYVDGVGGYDAVAHHDAIMAEAASRADLDAAPHFADARDEEARIRNLLLVGILLAAALPVLTIAGVTAGRRRWVATIAGSVVLVAGILALIAVSL